MLALEHRTLSSDTALDIDRHRSITGIVGINGHWGRKLSRYDVVKQASADYRVPEEELRKKDPGFEYIYQQDPNLDDAASRADEIEATVSVANEVIEAREWERPSIGGVILASGAPGIDDRRIPNYAREVANQLELPHGIPTLNVFAACNSSTYGMSVGHKRPEFRGKRILFVNVEGVTRLTKNPQRADITSFQVFSNAVAVTGLIPGVETEVYNHMHKIIPDKNGVLAARMTYKHLTVPITDREDEKQYWQVSQENNTEMIIMAEPPEGYDIWMEAMATFRFFGRNTGPFFLRSIKAYIEANPDKPLPPIFSHHPSRPVFDLFLRDLKRNDIGAPMPWLIDDGNSSAATAAMALHRGFEYQEEDVKDVTEPGKSVIMFGFGAGGSQDFVEIAFLDPNLHQAQLAA